MPAKSRCPLCRKPTVREFAPFCGSGCRDRDLLAWLGEDYRVPVRAAEDEDRDGRPAIPSEDED